jgi:hypothetical protein
MDCKLHQDNTDTKGRCKIFLKHTSEIKPTSPKTRSATTIISLSILEASGASGADEFVGITRHAESRVIHSSNMYKVEGDCNDWDENQIHLLEDIFQNLHSMLITNDKERRRLKLDLSSTPSPQAFRAPLCVE